MNIPRSCMHFLILAFSFLSSATAQQSVDPFILIVVPETDSAVTDASRYRISASTNPENKVAVNGTPFKVFPSGAFAGLLDLNEGENRFLIVAVSPTGKKAIHSLIIARTPALRSTPSDTLMIEDAMMEPTSDLWLIEGDVLTVQMKGTPGQTARFMNDIPMIERPARETGGIAGVYRGIYKVKATDTLTSQTIDFRLEDSAGRIVTRRSSTRVSYVSRKVPLVGIVRGERPFLNAGLGKDRLGGAKLSFINDGIRLAITGMAENQYRVALTENQEAWIPAEMIELQPQGTYPPFSLTGSIHVSGDDRFDYIAVALDDLLPYASFTDSDPTKIHVDIYGAVSNTNWITNAMTAKNVKNVFYTQVGKNLFRVTLELRTKQVWGYAISYKGTSLVIRVKRPPEELDLDGLAVAVDAGHGGDNKGALGSTGVVEKDITLAIAVQLKNILEEKGARVFMTRTNDDGTLNSQRIQKILPLDADLLISIHANSVGFTTNPLDVQGVSTYYKYQCYRPLSAFILDELVKSDLKSFGNVGNFNFALNSLTELPNVLVETAFVSNPEDEMKLMDDEFRREIAERIVDGLEAFLEWCEED